MSISVNNLGAGESALLAALSAESRDDPYTPLAQLRTLGPALRHDAFDTTFLTGFRECQAVLGNPAFLVPDSSWLAREQPDWLAHPAADFFYSSLLGRNGAEHDRLRRPLAGAFGARQVAALTAKVERAAGELLDRFADACAEGGSADFQEHLGYPLPIAVVGELIGVPREGQGEFRRLGQDAACLLEPVRTEEGWARADRAVTELREFFTALLRERRHRPGDDLASRLLACAGTEGLSQAELTDLLLLLFVAGFETTAGLLGLSVLALLVHPEQLAQLRDDPALLPAAVEESLRWDGPILMTERLASRPTVVGGTPVPAGGSVTVVMGAANRDPERFPEPDAFRIDRDQGRGLAFGTGPHYCVGAALARLEGAVLLGKVIARFPRLALAGAPVRRDSACLRSLESLPLSC